MIREEENSVPAVLFVKTRDGHHEHAVLDRHWAIPHGYRRNPLS